nr:unnamed protein product [Spirometra erinaceieuropaei]
MTCLQKGALFFGEKIRLWVNAKYQPKVNEAVDSGTIYLTTLLTCYISVPENESGSFKGPVNFLKASAVKIPALGDSSLLVEASGLRSPCLQFEPRRSFLYDTSFIIYCDFIPGVIDPLFGHRECFVAFSAQPRLWKSLGKSVSHILVSAKQGRNLIGLDCQTNVLFQSNDYGTNWQPVSKSFYEIIVKQSPEFLTWPKPTEIHRAEIKPGFSPTEYGKQCNRWSAGPWKICYNGIFYEDAMVLKWTNA